MKYLIMILVLLPDIYLLNYARYEGRSNKSAAVGAVILALITITLPIIVLFIGRLNY